MQTYKNIRVLFFLFGSSIYSEIRGFDALIEQGNGTTLGRGSVYGAVKYNGQWLAARILKSE